MNIFYAPPSQITKDHIELHGQEAVHATKSLRYERGDIITVVDGRGGWYEGQIQQISDKSISIVKQDFTDKRSHQPSVIMAIGIIKKRDRLEFAVEKAVELGVKEIALFRGDYSVKKNVRLERLQAIAISAMKQSLQAWLPQIKMYQNAEGAVEAHPTSQLMVAHQKGGQSVAGEVKNKNKLLMVGPEGGFSDDEMTYFKTNNGKFISMGPNRLRTETAVVTFLNYIKAPFG